MTAVLLGTPLGALAPGLHSLVFSAMSFPTDVALGPAASGSLGPFPSQGARCWGQLLPWLIYVLMADLSFDRSTEWRWERNLEVKPLSILESTPLGRVVGWAGADGGVGSPCLCSPVSPPV